MAAKNAGAAEVGSEHMLYGVVRQQGPAGMQRSDSAPAILRRVGIKPESILPLIKRAGDTESTATVRCPSAPHPFPPPLNSTPSPSLSLPFG